jgi:superfamily II DNA/RNA helicase
MVKIAGMLPTMRQTLMFSATVTDDIRKIAGKFLQNPREVAVAPPSQTASTITQELYYVSARQKRELLRRLLREKNVANAYIFCNRKRDVSVLTESLKRHGFNVAELHGDMVQSKRYETLADFKSGKLQIMVCSDVAARGLDIPDVACVVNFDIPFNSEDYVHRIGRTGRAGRTGMSISFATPDDTKLLDNVFSLTKQKINPTAIHGLTLDNLDAVESTHERKSSGRSERRTGRGGHPKSQPQNLPRAGHTADRPAQTTEPTESAGFDDDIPAFLRR